MQKYPLKANRFIAIVMTAALLPLVAIAAPGNEPSTQEPAQPINRSTTSTAKESVTTISNETPVPNGSADTAKDFADDLTPIGSDSNENGTSDSNGLAANSANDPIATKPSNTGSVTSALDQANERQRTKKAPWYNLNYLLGGGLLLLILGGALLLFLKISKLQDEIADLRGEKKSLESGLSKSTNNIKQLEKDKLDLKAELKKQKDMHNQPRSNNGVDDGLLPLQDAQVSAPVIEDLNAADRQQLTTSIDTWFATNRGQTKLTGLVPADIQKKLNHWRYAIELWGQGDGVDSVELVDSTKYGAVVSLTKPDKQGFAFCHKKPNSLSSVWVNKAWYEVQRTSSTLEVVGEPLEKN